MKKVLYGILTILEIGLFVGSYVFHYFTIKKLGMNRWVNFNSRQWESVYPISTIKIGILLFFIFMGIAILILYIKRRKMLLDVILTVAMTIVSGYFMIFYSLQEIRAYYFVCLMLIVATGLQMIKTGCGMVYKNDEK